MIHVSVGAEMKSSLDIEDFGHESTVYVGCLVKMLFGQGSIPLAMCVVEGKMVRFTTC